jgi:hypothetical protein
VLCGLYRAAGGPAAGHRRLSAQRHAAGGEDGPGGAAGGLLAFEGDPEQPGELRDDQGSLDQPLRLAGAVRVRVDTEVTVAGDEVVDQALVPLEALLLEQDLPVLGDLEPAAQRAPAVVVGGHHSPAEGSSLTSGASCSSAASST